MKETHSLKVAVSQLNFRIGDFELNTSKIADTIFEAKRQGADLVVFSEMSVSGYMPDDLLDYPYFIEKCEQSLELVAQSCQGVAAIVGGIVKRILVCRNCPPPPLSQAVTQGGGSWASSWDWGACMALIKGLR